MQSYVEDAKEKQLELIKDKLLSIQIDNNVETL